MENIKSITIQYLEHPEESDRSKQLTAGKFLFPGFTHEFSVRNIALPGGTYKYITGLDLESTEEDKVEEIKQVIEDLEKHYGKGVLDSRNEPFWKELRLKLNKKNTFLDIHKNPEHKLFYYIIRGGGIPEISPSYDSAISADQQNRWFMVEPEQLADLTAEDDKNYDKAISYLVQLDNSKTFDDLMIVHKSLVTSDRGITRQTPKSAIYKDLSDYVKGKLNKTDKKRTPSLFVETVDLLKKDKKKVYVTAYVKDAIYFNFIAVNQDNQFVNTDTKTKYGGTTEAVVSKLMNPAYQDELDNIKFRVEKKWSE